MGFCAYLLEVNGSSFYKNTAINLIIAVKITAYILNNGKCNLYLPYNIRH